MATTVLIYLTGSHAAPSADALAGCSTRLERGCWLEDNGNYVTEAATIGTGMLAIKHEVSMRKALAFDPLRLRPTCTTDSIYPWIWDLATSAGLRTAVVGWPGILDVNDSPSPMVSELALIGQTSDSGDRPVPSCSVSPGVSPEAIASARITPEKVDPAVLPDRSLWVEKPDGADEDAVDPVRFFMARAISTIAALEVLAEKGLDLAVISLGVPGTPEQSSALGTHLLDLALDRLPSILGPDLEFMIISSNRTVCRFTLAVNRSLEIPENFRLRIQDSAPTILGLLGLERPQQMRGHNLLHPNESASSDLKFESPPVGSHSDLDRLVEAFEAGELAALPEDQNQELQHFARRKLSQRVVFGIRHRDFKYVLENGELLVRLHPVQQTLWTVAYAANRVGDLGRSGEISRRLLEEFPGTPEAILSGLLSSDSIPIAHQRVIVDSIQPEDLTAATMRSLWGRTAIGTDRVDDGIEVLNSLIKEGRHFPIDRFILAMTLHARGDYQDAMRALARLGSMPGADIKMQLLRASILLGLGDHEASRTLLEMILVRFPHEKRAVSMLKKLDPER